MIFGCGNIGANFVITQNKTLSAVDFNFNAWGNKQHHSRDPRAV